MKKTWSKQYNTDPLIFTFSRDYFKEKHQIEKSVGITKGLLGYTPEV